MKNRIRNILLEAKRIQEDELRLRVKKFDEWLDYKIQEFDDEAKRETKTDHERSWYKIGQRYVYVWTKEILRWRGAIESETWENRIKKPTKNMSSSRLYKRALINSYFTLLKSIKEDTHRGDPVAIKERFDEIVEKFKMDVVGDYFDIDTEIEKMKSI